MAALLWTTLYQVKQAKNQTALTDATTAVTNPVLTTQLKEISQTNIFPQQTPTSTNRAPTPVIDKPVPVVSKNVYNNGTYTATGSYNSPGGVDFVGVSLTLKNDIITGVTVTPTAQDGTSRRYQAKFVSGYKQYVFGKDITSVHLDVVSGSSLTPKGFNAALAKIESEAKV